MRTALTPSCSFVVVALTYRISVCGSLIAPLAARHIVSAQSHISTHRSVTSGIALGGIGVWAMRYVGMLALKCDGQQCSLLA